MSKNLRLGGGVGHRRSGRESGREGFPGRGDCKWKRLDLERAWYVQGAGRRQTDSRTQRVRSTWGREEDRVDLGKDSDQ